MYNREIAIIIRLGELGLEAKEMGLNKELFEVIQQEYIKVIRERDKLKKIVKKVESLIDVAQV